GFGAGVAARVGEDLVFEVGRGHAGGDVELGGALDVEDVAVAPVHVDDRRWDVEVPRGDALLRVAHRHGQLELTQRAHGAAGGVGDFDARAHGPVRGGEMVAGGRV